MNAQVVSDAKLWTSVTVNKKYNDFKFSISEELRFNENISHVDKVFTELGVQYKVSAVKGLYLGLNYRFNRDNDYESENYDFNQRIDFSLAYKYKLNDFKLSFRTKMQSKTAPSNENNPLFNRNKLSIRYKANKIFAPFISYEFFYQFNDQNTINRTRVSMGTSYKINKRNNLKLFYTFENRFNTNNLRNNHIWGISYSLDL